MSYTLEILWFDRQRYLAGVLAVAFSAILIDVQCGLLLGLFSVTSRPVDWTRADLWLMAPQVQSVDTGRPIPRRFLTRLASQPEVTKTEVYLQGFSFWSKPGGGSSLCMVIGCRLADESLGIMKGLGPTLRERLSEPDAVVVNRKDLRQLGIQGVGETAKIAKQEVRVVGLVEGLENFAGPLVFCSIRTARKLLKLAPDQTVYVLGRCQNSEDAAQVARRLQQKYDDVTVLTRSQFSWRTRLYWLTMTKAGVALGYTAVLGLLVGGVVTSQTLYSATVASFKQYATLEALGVSRWYIGGLILRQAFWLGIAGVLIAFPGIYVLARVASWLGVDLHLPWWLLLSGAVVTLFMAMFSGLLSLRSLREMNMMALLR